jgi:hypothetical protein
VSECQRETCWTSGEPVRSYADCGDPGACGCKVVRHSEHPTPIYQGEPSEQA